MRGREGWERGGGRGGGEGEERGGQEVVSSPFTTTPILITPL